MNKDMDLHKINSLTKYPSILTYHQLGEKGRLNEALTEPAEFGAAEHLYVYEKVDGENSRIILLSQPSGEIDYLIGSREELLYAKGDRIGNPYGNIAEFLRPVAERIIAGLAQSDSREWALTVLYQESYGGKTKASRHYSDNKTQNYRVFDVFSLDREQLDAMLALPQDQIASWRDRGKQPFYDESAKKTLLDTLNLQAAPLLDQIDRGEFPVSFADTFAYMQRFEQTQVGMEVAGRAEGLIVRTVDRSWIRKIRFEDYERTFRK